MPQRDGTGPQGQGKGIGRGLGRGLGRCKNDVNYQSDTLDNNQPMGNQDDGMLRQRGRRQGNRNNNSTRQ